jgi:hypothetical protein
VTPIGLIGLSLIYFDQRVRQEAFDLLMMLGPVTVPPAVPVVYAEPVAVAPVAVEPIELASTSGEGGSV